jgi:hypothetical protein
MSPAPPAPPPSPQPRKNLTNDDRRAIFERLLELSDRGKLPRGAINNVATTWGRDRATITRIWCRGTASRLHGHAAANVASKIKGIDFDSVCGSILKVIRYQSVLILANCGPTAPSRPKLSPRKPTRARTRSRSRTSLPIVQTLGRVRLWSRIMIPGDSG